MQIHGHGPDLLSTKVPGPDAGGVEGSGGGVCVYVCFNTFCRCYTHSQGMEDRTDRRNNLKAVLQDQPLAQMTSDKQGLW